MYLRTLATAFLFFGAWPATLRAQFNFKSRPIQIHGFASQGFAKSDNNNYLTMDTSGGSFELTDAGLNATMQVTNKLRVGAQVYIRNIGTLGDWHPTLDWAVADYKFDDWLGVRAGKVKTVFGLYNDTQDMESLHTWAVLPQSLYPLDLRSSTIAHLGGDIYGEIPLPKNLGGLAYTAYAGRRFDDKYGGYRNVALQTGAEMDKITGWMAGGDLRWNNPSPGLTLGASWLKMPFEGDGTLVAYNLPVKFSTDSKSFVFYVDYLRGNLHLTGEHTRGSGPTEVTGVPGVPTIREDSLGWYTSLAYRVLPKLELGAYHSRFVSDTRHAWDSPANHIYDQAITARFDFNRHWNFKIEGHIMDGYGSVYSARGFYLSQNPNGFDRKTNMIVLRTGYMF